ncbi:MAG: LysR family transcriptional regulator, partial [Oscillospiraceae bacterium]
MYISYDYYRVFYYVAKYKSISQAAKILLNNQPNVTRTIKSLENALGCKLFVRSSHGVSLTYEGERLFNHVQIAFDHLESGEEEIALNKTLQRGA